jgi:hypothetical protein
MSSLAVPLGTTSPHSKPFHLGHCLQLDGLRGIDNPCSPGACPFVEQGNGIDSSRRFLGVDIFFVVSVF